jgi:hypothetical protein
MTAEPGKKLGVRAKCSRCDYLRTFAEELRGTFYRCPKCREGVIAVPAEGGQWAEPSDEAPAVRAAVDESSGVTTARAADAAGVPGGSSADGSQGGSSADGSSADGSREGTSADGSSVAGSSADEEPAITPRKSPPTDETPRGAFFGTGPDAASSTERSLPEQPSSSDDTSESLLPGSPTKAVVGSPSGRRPVKVRRILVECGLCGNHVAVPPELFGKTVHCPECRADMMFSESSLEPVKDEIIGRIALEQAERRALAHAIPGPIPSPNVVARNQRRNLVVVVLLIAALLGGLLALIVRLVTR